MFKIQEERTERRYADKIIRKKWVQGKTYYYVLWKGRDIDQGTWLPMNKLSNLFRMVRQFQNKLKASRRKYLQQQSKTKKRRSNQEEGRVVEEEQSPKKSVFLPPQQCISLISESQEESRDNDGAMEEQKIKVSRFDCVRGIWVNWIYSAEELRKIEEMRYIFAWRHQCDKAKIDKIVRINGELVVIYQRNGKKYNCLLSNFKSYLPKLLIKFMLKQYDPVLGEIKKSIETEEKLTFQ